MCDLDQEPACDKLVLDSMSSTLMCIKCDHSPCDTRIHMNFHDDSQLLNLEMDVQAVSCEDETISSPEVKYLNKGYNIGWS